MTPVLGSVYICTIVLCGLFQVSKVMAILQDSDFQWNEDPDPDDIPQTKHARAISPIPDVEVT